MDIRALLQEKGYKYTSQRKAVYETFLKEKDRHMTTEDVYLEVRKHAPNIGIATIYRTVQLLEEVGVLTTITFDDGVVRYELKQGNKTHNHHHLLCTECNKVIEVNLDLLDSLEAEIERDEKFHIVDHNVKFYGYCQDCYNKLKGAENE